jgi:glycine/D-amino acid oxidase-like deaminating enzyme
MASLNRSPWIYQLDHNRVPLKLLSDIHTDVAIVGGGIAGVATAFFTLKHTGKKVVLLEKGKLAHGATGHNGGQIVSYFERPLHELVEEFGFEQTISGQREIDYAWGLIDEMYTEAGLDIPFSRFTGYAGMTSFSSVMTHLKDNEIRRRGNLTEEEFLIADDVPFIESIPLEYRSFYRIVPRKIILDKLETDNGAFLGCLSAQKGCMNSALFCQEVIRHLLKKYPQRFSLFEHTHIGKVILRHDHALLDGYTHTVTADRVVLCTNGFESIHILNESGLDIDTRFHHFVTGVIGFMTGYLESYVKPPTAISYIDDTQAVTDDTETEPYFYFTRRQYEYEGNPQKNLISVGGPAILLSDRTLYEMEADYSEGAWKDLDRFIRTVYRGEDGVKVKPLFRWHGLMGYTTNGVRLIGEEPKNPVLLYNLGCNGVGLLPSIYGGRKISRFLSGETLPPSIFDPQLGDGGVISDEQ